MIIINVLFKCYEQNLLPIRLFYSTTSRFEKNKNDFIRTTSLLTYGRISKLCSSYHRRIIHLWSFWTEKKVGLRPLNKVTISVEIKNNWASNPDLLVLIKKSVYCYLGYILQATYIRHRFTVTGPWRNIGITWANHF